MIETFETLNMASKIKSVGKETSGSYCHSCFAILPRDDRTGVH